jgi:hypothetical protein
MTACARDGRLLPSTVREKPKLLSELSSDRQGPDRQPVEEHYVVSKRRPKSVKERNAPVNPLAAALQALPATGPQGFEVLIATLLGSLTGVAFLPGRSGDQKGRDLDSERRAPWLVVVECKKYRDTTALNERELQSEINIAVEAEPQLDLWVLASSRYLDANLSRWLEQIAKTKAVDYLVLSCGTPQEPASLDFLCAAFAAAVLTRCKAFLPDTSALEAYLSELRAAPGFTGALSNMRAVLAGPTVGFPTFRNRLNEDLAHTMASNLLSRGRLNVPLVVEAPSTPSVARTAFVKGLTDFFRISSDGHRTSLCVVHGEEGNGKSWALASWLNWVLRQKHAPAVFWFSSSDCRDEGPLSELSRLAGDRLSLGRTIDFRAKLERWLGRSGQASAIIVLDGINERHDAGFWARYLVRLIGELERRVSVVLTCRSQTWQGNLADLVGLRAHLIEVGPFDDDEFSAALAGLDQQTIERLWRLGPLARKPRYLADAIEYVKEHGSAESLTVERLYYEAWNRRTRTRTDYPLASMRFESLLMHLASQLQNRIAARQVMEGLPVISGSQDILGELATGGVLREVPGGFRIEEPYLVEGLSLLLVDVLRTAAGHTSELRQRIAEWLGDTHLYPLTAKICAASSYKVLLDPDVRTEVAVALTLEFLNCQNASQESIDGILSLACGRTDVIAALCEELWSVHGVDSSVERAILRGLVRAAETAQRGDALVNVLTRWAGFVHEDGELRRTEPSEHLSELRGRVRRLAPQEGRVVLDSDGTLALTRIGNQRLLRLARLALAVVSFADRQMFFPVLLSSLLADAVIRGSRTEVCMWILTSSRQPLQELTAEALERVEGLQRLEPDEANRVGRALLSALGAPQLAGRLEALRAGAPRSQIEERFARIFNTPKPEEVPGYLVDRTIASRHRLALARKMAKDPDFKYPDAFVSEFLAAARSFDATQRRKFLGTSEQDLSWELFEPVLCRVAPALYEQKILEFARAIAARDDEGTYAWMFAADSFVRVFGLPEVDLLGAAWERQLAQSNPQNDKWQTIESTLFGMLLPFMTPVEQVQGLQRRDNDARNLVSFSSEFQQVSDPAAQAEIAEHASKGSTGLDAALWFASSQSVLDENVWLPVVERGLASPSSVTRGLAMEALRLLPDSTIAPLVGHIKVTASDDICALERHFGTLLQLKFGTGKPADILARCDLGVCSHLLGTPFRQNDNGLALAFARHVLAWMQERVRPGAAPASAIPVAIRNPSTIDAPWAGISVDWAKVDDSVTFRDEMATWGGLTPDEHPELAFNKAFDSDGRRHNELQQALTDALESAHRQEDWGYAAFWSDETLRALIDSSPIFLERVDALLEDAVRRRLLQPLVPFVASLARCLIRDGVPRGWHYFQLIGGESGIVRSVDGLTGDDLLDKTLFGAAFSPEAEARWLQKLEATKSDAVLMLRCEQLIDGGHQKWLLARAKQDLTSEAPYFRRRGLLLLAAAEPEDAEFEKQVAAINVEQSGFEEVLQIARAYRDRGRWMKHWLNEGMKATSSLEARCSATLLLECVDRRVWPLLSAAARTARDTLSGKEFLAMLPHNDVTNAVKSNQKDENKRLLVFKVCEHDAAPWIE